MKCDSANSKSGYTSAVSSSSGKHFSEIPTKKGRSKKCSIYVYFILQDTDSPATAILNSRQQGQAKVQELPLVIPVSSTDS